MKVTQLISCDKTPQSASKNDFFFSKAFLKSNISEILSTQRESLGEEPMPKTGSAVGTQDILYLCLDSV